MEEGRRQERRDGQQRRYWPDGRTNREVEKGEQRCHPQRSTRRYFRPQGWSAQRIGRPGGPLRARRMLEKRRKKQRSGGLEPIEALRWRRGKSAEKEEDQTKQQRGGWQAHSADADAGGNGDGMPAWQSSERRRRRTRQKRPADGEGLERREKKNEGGARKERRKGEGRRRRARARKLASPPNETTTWAHD